jgi:hypothetical protein
MGRQKIKSEDEIMADNFVEKTTDGIMDNLKDAIIESEKIINKTVKLIFKHNRTFELIIGKKNHIFGPKEGKDFPAEIIKHPDFLQQKDYFIVKEVK